MASHSIAGRLGHCRSFDSTFTAPYLYDSKSSELVKDSGLGFMVAVASARPLNAVGLFFYLIERLIFFARNCSFRIRNNNIIKNDPVKMVTMATPAGISYL